MSLLLVLASFLTMMVVLMKTAFWLKRRRASVPRIPAPTLVIIGSGGHTTEMLTIVELMDVRLYSPRIYVVAHSDSLSPKKIETLEAGRSDFLIYPVFRAREVGQSWTSTIFQSLPKSFYDSYLIIQQHRPSLVLCNGPGICVPIALIVTIYKILFNLECIIVYVESVCRVFRLSVTGKILRYLSDHFIVQWTELKQGKKDVEYFGRIS